MEKKLFKIFLVALVVGIGVCFPLNQLDALGAQWCTGSSDCQEVEDACFEDEIFYSHIVTTQCYWWYECQTTVHVHCFDEEECDFYYRYVYCYNPIGAGDNCED